MAGNAGKGRRKGATNKRTAAVLALLQDGESPVQFGLRLMRDESQTAEIRLAGAKLVAPYVHPRPQPQPRYVTFELQDALGSNADLLAAHTSIIGAAASGAISIEEAKELSSVLETQRRLVETTDLEGRISKLEKEMPSGRH
jgi:hypothetical protein